MGRKSPAKLTSGVANCLIQAASNNNTPSLRLNLGKCRAPERTSGPTGPLEGKNHALQGLNSPALRSLLPAWRKQ